MRYLFVMMWSVLAIVPGCDWGPDPQRISIRGRVFDSDGRTRITGAQVSTVPPTSVVITGEDGYVLEDIPEGEYVVKASYNGRTSPGVTVAVGVGSDVAADLVLASSTDHGDTMHADLIAFYRLDGDGLDDGPNALHASVVYGQAARNRYGAARKAMAMVNGLLMDVEPSSAFSAFPITVEGWFYIPKDQRHGYTPFLGKYVHPSGEGWDLFLENGRLNCSYHTNSWAAYQRIDGPLTPIGEWFHVVASWSDTTVFLMVNGRVHVDGPIAGENRPTTSEAPFRLGNVPSTMPESITTIDMIMDDVRIYRRALSIQEARQLYVP